MGSESLLFGFQFLIFWRRWTDNLTRIDSAKISFENLWIRGGEDGNGNGILGDGIERFFGFFELDDALQTSWLI